MAVRQDNWTKEDDKVLVSTILKGVRAGVTQKESFYKAAIQLDRTSNACGFRWNSVLRHKNTVEFKEARLNRIKVEDYVRSHRIHKYSPLISISSVQDIWCHVDTTEGLLVKVTILHWIPTEEQIGTGEYHLLSQMPMSIN